ncbi:MAG: acyl-CoA thioesterase [Candidatus Hydrogenedentes bacterium]|nr:acyl-CoA thioesterase [Candidatus Hydrogenedentota bacterium]
MPRTHERTFRVRHYECDAYDTVYYTNYLRYIQETAMDASAAAGFGAEWYASRGFVWLVRETEIEFIEPLRYGDSVRVKTWVRNMRQALSKRAYELYCVADDRLVARAQTDWAFIESATGKPARITPEFRDAFFPEGAPPEEPRERFPAPPSPPPGAYVQRRRVEWRDIDPAQHVNNSVYLAYSEDCAVEAATACGWPPTRMRERGFAVEISRCRIEYRIPAVLGDELAVTTWLSERGDGNILRHFSIDRSDTTLSRAVAELRCIDPTTRTACSFPDEFRNALAQTFARVSA